MVEKKVKSRDQVTPSRKKDGEDKKRKRPRRSSKNKSKKAVVATEKRPRRGPRLPNALQRELGAFKRAGDGEPSDGDDEIGSDDDVIANDLYEYEEDIPQEESMKNKRFDPVDNYQFELPEKFENWKVSSEDEDGDDNDEDENQDEGRHSRMLEEITGLPSDAFGGKKKKDFVISEAYPESEYNPSGDILDGDGRISMDDLLDPLHGKAGISKLKRSLIQMKKKTNPTLAPLPKTEQEKLERQAVYHLTRKEVSKWEPVVKRNREAPTLYFDDDVPLGHSTIGTIASEFVPRTDFEKKMASLVNQNEFDEAHKKDGARLLELNKISKEEMMDRHERLAKMRSLLFRHELKSKRVKKIKSKTYHRLLKKDKKKAAQAANFMDPEAAKEQAMKQEYKRILERSTLKHKNNSKWAKRILERGLDVQDEATREAFAAQLNEHTALTRKQNSMKESSSSDDSSDDDDSDDDISAGSDQDMASKLLTKAKEKTLKVLGGDEELPESGVLSLPFMVRGLKKRKEAADEEAKLALEGYELSLKQLGDQGASSNHDKGASSGRMSFGAPKKVVKEAREKEKINNFYGNSDSEDDIEADEDNVKEQNQNDKRHVEIDLDVLREEFDTSHDSIFKSFEGAEDPEPKTTYEVAYLASDKWKMANRSSKDATTNQTRDNNIVRKAKVVTETMEHDVDSDAENDDDSDAENDDDSDADSGEEMVDGILSSGPKSTYELPSQAELIKRAFAGDDVEEDFEKDKEAILNEENPEPEKPVLLPGWGQWTAIQKKNGVPSWMVQEHDTAKKKRMESLKKRKDAHLKHVIISEKLDKKAEKLHTKTLPYPFTSTEVFEQSIRIPMGPEFNPATSIGALIRPEVVKRTGMIIKPISFEERSTHERAESRKRGSQNQRKGKDNNNQSTKKMKTAKA